MTLSNEAQAAVDAYNYCRRVAAVEINRTAFNWNQARALLMGRDYAVERADAMRDALLEEVERLNTALSSLPPGHWLTEQVHRTLSLCDVDHGGDRQ